MSADVRSDDPGSQAADKLWRMIAEHPVCMMTTLDGGLLRARPLYSRPDREAGLIRFVTGIDMHKVDEIERERQLCLAYAYPEYNLFASISGTGRVSLDRETLRAIWLPLVDAWFPDGPDGGDACLLEVAPERAEFWDRPGKPIELLKLVEARLAHERPEMGEDRKIDFER